MPPTRHLITVQANAELKAAQWRATSLTMQCNVVGTQAQVHVSGRTLRGSSLAATTTHRTGATSSAVATSRSHAGVSSPVRRCIAAMLGSRLTPARVDMECALTSR